MFTWITPIFAIALLMHQAPADAAVPGRLEATGRAHITLNIKAVVAAQDPTSLAEQATAIALEGPAEPHKAPGKMRRTKKIHEELTFPQCEACASPCLICPYGDCETVVLMEDRNGLLRPEPWFAGTHCKENHLDQYYDNGTKKNIRCPFGDYEPNSPQNMLKHLWGDKQKQSKHVEQLNELLTRKWELRKSKKCCTCMDK